MGTELQRAMSEARLGRPVEDALQEVSDRMGSDDFEWAVMAIKIQREVGGNLAELLMTVSETMIARERLRREVKALTAEGRISAIVLTMLPPIIGALISFMNPTYMEPLFQNTLGQYALVGAGIMIGVGYWAMMKLIEIEA
jgi:tight adherence protein B